MDGAISGILVLLDDGPVIAFNGSHPAERQRFTVAHELGHLLLGHLKTFHVDLSAPIDSHKRPGYSRSHERGANEFAANLLMPEAWVRERIDGEPLEVLASRTFEVSELAFGYRLMNLGIKPPLNESPSVEQDSRS